MRAMGQKRSIFAENQVKRPFFTCKTFNFRAFFKNRRFCKLLLEFFLYLCTHYFEVLIRINNHARKKV